MSTNQIDFNLLLSQLDNDKDLLKSISYQFLNLWEDEVLKIHVSIKDNDPDALQESAHRLKGICMNFRADKVVNLCKKLELLSEKYIAGEAQNLLTELNKNISQMADELRTQVQEK